MSTCYLFWAVGLLLIQYAFNFLHGFAHVSIVGFVHPKFSLQDFNAKLGLLPSRRHVLWCGSVSVAVKCQGSKTE